MKHWVPFLVVAMACGCAADLRAADVGLIRIKGIIGPATANYIARAAEVAARRHDACLIVQLDTPGGSLDSTAEIVQAFYDSSAPVVVFVTPSSARAASAGCFITLAADVAAMAPHTHIGAAHPVVFGPGGSEKLDDVEKLKMVNDASSFIRGIAEKRGRNADWAVSSVRDSASITAEEALDSKVIDLIATDTEDLLRQLDGRESKGGVLKTAGARIVEIPMAAHERLFQLLATPDLMFLLMLVAIYGIIGELSSPGAILPGVAGAIALILALYLATILPLNLTGVALIGLAMVLFIIDIYAPTHGVLTFGGIVSFFLGALMLFNRAESGFRLSLAYIIPATLVTAAFFIFVVGAGLRAQLLPVRAGGEILLGKAVPALGRIDGKGGRVFVEGEYWNAVSDTPVEPGQTVEIVGRQGLVLRVKPKQLTS